MNNVPRVNTAALLLALAASALAQPAGPPPGMPPGFPPMGPPPVIVAAVEVNDGAVRRDSKAGVSITGKTSGTTGTGVEIDSKADKVNGLFVRGQSSFTLANSKVVMSGQGTSDFDGVAAGALVKDGSTLTLRNVSITTNGVVSSAVTATDASTLHVHHSRLTANGGPVPSGYVRRIGPGMMEPPTPLGISGTARTTLTMGSAKAYYHDSLIVAEGWGALSTDAARGAYLEANRCTIRVLRSGYGTYADNGATVVINDSTLDVPTFGGVIAGQASLALNRVRMVSGGNGVMIHSVMGSPAEVATLQIRGGRIASTNAVIVVKSANADITIDSAQLVAKNGDLLLGVMNDDSHATQVAGQKVAGITATISHSQLNGNLVHLDTARGMAVRFIGSSLKGAIRSASVAFDAGSRWTATADSRVTLVGAVDAAQLDAPAGVTITATAGPEAGDKGSRRLRGGGVLLLQ